MHTLPRWEKLYRWMTLNTATVSVKFSDNDLGLNAVLNFGDEYIYRRKSNLHSLLQ